MATKNTFVTIAPDSPVLRAEIPPDRSQRSRARIEYDLLSTAPYTFTHETLSHRVHSEVARDRNETPEDFAAFHEKGRACIRASPLTKRYGWGVHYDAEGRMALCPAGSADYESFVADPTIRKDPAMRSRRG